MNTHGFTTKSKKLDKRKFNEIPFREASDARTEISGDKGVRARRVHIDKSSSQTCIASKLQKLLW